MLSLDVRVSTCFRRRIQPLHLFVMCLTMGLISLVRWGPYWFPFIDALMDCKTYWWANFLLISNLIPVHEIVSFITDSQWLYCLFGVLTFDLLTIYSWSHSLPSVFPGRGTSLWTSSVTPPPLCWSTFSDCTSEALWVFHCRRARLSIVSTSVFPGTEVCLCSWQPASF